MEPIFHKKVQKFIQKLKDKKLYQKIKTEIDLIIEEPNKGKVLEHPFRKYQIRCISFPYKSNSLRIAYFIDLEEREIVFLLIDSRENFYEKLKKIL